MKKIKLENVHFGNESLSLIAGPCVIESQSHAIKMAKNIRDISEKVDIPVVYKSSFDKANRTSISSYRGPGIEKGLDILAEVKATVKLLF